MKKVVMVLLLVCIFSLNHGQISQVSATDSAVEFEKQVQADVTGSAAGMESQIQDNTAAIAAELEGQVQDNTEDTFIDFEGWVQDDAGLLTAQEEDALESECGRLFNEHGAGVYIVTTPDFGGGDIKDWQGQVFSEYNLGADSDGSGVMLAISMAERDWGLVGFGAAQEAFSTYGRERLGGLILDDLSEGDFYEAFSKYLSIADDYLLAEEEGSPYTEKHRYGEGWRIPLIIGVSFLLSLIVSACVVMFWKKGMNTRVRQNGAMDYLKAGSFYLSNQSDMFLYHTVSRTQRPKNNSSSSGGGGMSSNSSGTSGKF